MKTMTGRPCPGSTVGDSGNSGVHTLSERQSSLCGSEDDGSDGLVIPGTAADCGAIGPNVDASRIALQLSASNGGRHRNAPTGGRPYGIPENDHRSSRQTPLSLPWVTETTPCTYGDPMETNVNGQSNHRSDRYPNGR